MKLILLAAAAVIALPAIAQTTPPAGAPMPNGSMTPSTQTTPDAPAAPATDPAPAAPQDTAPMTTQAQTMPPQPMAPQTTGDSDPVGGYQPTTPSSPTPAGATVTYQQAPSPDQAYPAPAPLAKYPVCKPGQYDNCMQRGSGTSSSRRRR